MGEEMLRLVRQLLRVTVDYVTQKHLLELSEMFFVFVILRFACSSILKSFLTICYANYTQ